MSESFTVPFGLSLRELEREYVLATLKRNNCQRGLTARALKIQEKSLYNKLKCYGVADEYPSPRSPAKKKGRNYGKANRSAEDGAGAGRPHARKAGGHHPQALGLFDLASRRWGQEPEDRDRPAGEAD
jgi:hypothetical protein